MGKGAKGDIIQSTGLYTHGRTRAGFAAWRAVLTSGAGYPQRARQGLQVVLRRPNEVPEVQEVLFVGLVHISSSVQWVREARFEKETAFPVEGRERPYRLPSTSPDGLSPEDFYD